MQFPLFKISAFVFWRKNSHTCLEWREGNDDRIDIFGWTIPLRVLRSQSWVIKMNTFFHSVDKHNKQLHGRITMVQCCQCVYSQDDWSVVISVANLSVIQTLRWKCSFRFSVIYIYITTVKAKIIHIQINRVWPKMTWQKITTIFKVLALFFQSMSRLKQLISDVMMLSI